MKSHIYMMRWLVFLLFSLPGWSLKAQEIKCLTDSIFKSKTNASSGIHPSMQLRAQETGIRTIPTVVHVIYQHETDNISDDQVLSQMVVLNKDFRRHNADTVNTDSIFKPVTADMEIEFCLATIDPSGNPTNGIVHTLDSTSNSFQLIRNYGWDNKKYLNIYVTPAIGAFSSFPWSPDSTDGIFIQNYRFGTIGTAGSHPIDYWSKLGRTCTHEVGHYIGLMHTFCFCGSEDDVRISCDSVYDTPPADIRLAIGTCLPHGQYSCFLDLTLPDQVDNFMDYNIDSCSNMFSLGQKARADFWMSYKRPRLTSDSNLIATGCFSTTGLTNISGAEKISVFPNPNNGTFTISAMNSFQHGSELLLLNELGEKVYMTELPEVKSYTFSLQNIPAGIYLISIRKGSQLISAKMMIER